MVEIDKLPTRIFALADSALAIFPAFRAESLDVLVGQQSAIFSKGEIDCYICKTLTNGSIGNAEVSESFFLGIKVI